MKKDDQRVNPVQRRVPPKPKAAVEAIGAVAGNRAMGELITSRGQGQDEAADVAIQRDVVADVESKMSYGVVDWAITDAEATSALASLASIPGARRADELKRLSTEAMSRLIVNLPDSALGTVEFTKVAISMGLKESQKEFASLKINDAVVADNPAAVFELFIAIDAKQKAALLKGITAASCDVLANALVRTAMGVPEKAAARSLFNATPATRIDALKKIMHYRFRIDFGTQVSTGEVAQEWDDVSLRRMYNVLQSLPDGAVENNPNLARIDRYQATGGAGGYYDSSDNRVALGMGTSTALDNTPDAAGVDYGGMTVDLADPMVGQNIFDGTVRHEVGHAVDQRLGLSTKYASTAGGATWQQHGVGTGLATRLVVASGGYISTLAPKLQMKVINVLQDTIDNRTPLTLPAALKAISLGKTAPWKRKGIRAKILADNAVVALRTSFADMTPGNPWYRGANDGGISLGGRIFVESYANEWNSYLESARSRKVSSYQFRAPGEWIAEAYNAYYAPPRKGARLATVDAATKAWFDVNVDEATGGKGAKGKGPKLPEADTGPGFP